MEKEIRQPEEFTGCLIQKNDGISKLHVPRSIANT